MLDVPKLDVLFLLFLQGSDHVLLLVVVDTDTRFFFKRQYNNRIKDGTSHAFLLSPASGIGYPRLPIRVRRYMV